ncbi:MAG: hypothetical protein GY928_25845 [Colwellia sp.]|nr:hypothetical protein [Colwellia sp.]
MAGSLNHLIDEETGKFTMDLIDNLGDAKEALEECFSVIYDMTGGSKKKIDYYLKARKYPKIKRDMSVYTKLSL